MKISIHSNARKYLDALPAKQRDRLMRAIFRLPSGDVKPMAGRVAFFRLRVGGYRIIFQVIQDAIVVREVGPRGDIYK